MQPENPGLSVASTFKALRRQKDPLAKARYDQVTAVSVATLVASTDIGVSPRVQLREIRIKAHVDEAHVDETDPIVFL